MPHLLHRFPKACSAFWRGEEFRSCILIRLKLLNGPDNRRIGLLLPVLPVVRPCVTTFPSWKHAWSTRQLGLCTFPPPRLSRKTSCVACWNLFPQTQILPIRSDLEFVTGIHLLPNAVVSKLKPMWYSVTQTCCTRPSCPTIPNGPTSSVNSGSS